MKLQKVRQNSYKGEVNNLVKNFERLWRMTDRCYQKLSLYDDTVEKLNNTASELNDKLSGIESSVSACIDSVADMSATLEEYDSRITEVEDNSGNAYDDSELTTRVTTLESKVRQLDELRSRDEEFHEELAQATLGIGGDNVAHDYTEEPLLTRIETLESQMSTNTSNVATNTSNISALTTNVDNYYNTNARNITTLSDTVDGLSDSLDTTNSNVEAIENQINNLGTLYSNQVQVTTVNNTGTTVVSAGGYCTTQFVIPDGLVLVGLLGFTINGGNIPNLRVKHYFVNNVEYPYIVGCYVENLTDLEITFEMTCIMATLPL